MSITSALSVGGVFAVTGAATFTANPTLSGGTANGVLYLDGSKVATSGSALTFDGTTFGVTSTWGSNSQLFTNATASNLSGITARYNGANKGYLYFDNSTSLYNLYGEAGISLAFTANAAEGMRLNSTGLGIGTSSPTTRLTVSGTTTVNTAADATAGLVVKTFGTAGGTQPIANFQRSDAAVNFQIGFNGNTGDNFAGTTTNHNLFFITNNTEKLRLDTSGNLGIGTSSPGASLQVAKTTNALSGTGNTFGLYVYPAGSGICYVDALTSTTGNTDLTLRTYNNGTYNTLIGSISGGTATFFQTGGTERLRIDASGNVGIGGTASATDKFTITGTLPTSGATTIGAILRGTIPSGTTGTAYGFYSAPNTQAASFTATSIQHFRVDGVTIGAGSAVTNQFGYVAESNLTTATNNYGFYSNIASGSNRWNFYANGTANNYFAGNTGVGSTDLSVTRLRVTGAGTTSATYATYMDTSGGTLLFSVRNDGVFYTGTHTNSPYNLTTASAANCFINSDGALYRSTSSLRYKSDVADAAHGLAEVLKLRSVTYKSKNDGDTVFSGLIAEEVHDAGLTEFVAYDKEGRPDALHYGNMVALLVKAVQELSAKVVALEAR